MPHTFLPAFEHPAFSLQVAPDAAIPHPAWRRARVAALEALACRRNAVLVGPPGSGKTLLLRNLAHTLLKAGQPVHLVGQAEAAGSPVAGGALLVDEADALGTDALAVLYAGAGPVLLAMLPGGPERLPRRLHPVRSIVLDRLAPLEVAQFIAARLAAAGRPGDLMEPEAVLALARHSSGLPRLVNVFGGAAAFLASLEGSSRISLRHVDEAASMRADAAEDVPLAAAGPFPVEPPSLTLDAALSSYRGAVLRRRAALGGMVAASAALFALPWLTSKRAGGVQQASTEGTAQAAQAEPGAPALAAGPQAAADDEAFETFGAGSAPVEPLEQPQPDVQTAIAEAAPPPPAAPARLDGQARPAIPPGERPAVVASNAPLLFRGPIFNETMNQGGRVTLAIRKQAPTGAITARFDASQGLSGSGTLAGSVSGAGRITASGQLLMGRNAFMCDISGVLDGNTLTGSASFVRNGNSRVYHSRFNLVRV